MRHRMRMLLWRAVWFVLLSMGGVLAGAAYAAIVTFTDPQTFFQAGHVVSTETFDELPSRTIIGVGTIHLDGVTYASADPLAQWVTNDSFVTPSPPNSLVQANVGAPATLTFGAGGHTDAIGFFLLPGSTLPGGDYRFDVVAASGQTLSVDSGIVGQTIFRGFVLTDGVMNGITALSITPLPVPGGISNFNLDNVSRGAIAFGVPEPPVLGLATIAILSLLACRSRHSEI